MIRFAAVRLLQAIPVLFGVITITFILIHSAPGGPFSADKAVPPEVLIALEEKYDWQPFGSLGGAMIGFIMGTVSFVRLHKITKK